MANSYKKTLRGYIFCILLIPSMLMLFSFNSLAEDKIKIGLVCVFSGPFEYGGRYSAAAVQFVADEQNAKGGFFGKKIEVITEDSEMKADVAIRKAKKLILEDKIQILAVGSGSHIGIALNKLATQYKTLTILHAAAADSITGREFSRYSFRVGHVTSSYTEAFGQLLASRPYKKFYLLNMDYAAGRDQGKAFRDNITKFIPDAQIVGEDYHPINNKDFGPYITKIINSKAEAIYSMNWGPDLSLLVRQSRSFGMKAPFINMFMSDPTLMTDIRDAGIGTYWAHVYSMRVNTPENQAMIAKYHAQHKNDKNFDTWWPHTNIGMYICGWQMTLAAIEKAGSLDPEKVIPTFEGFTYKTPVGEWTMRPCDHQAIFPMFGGVIEGGWNPYFNGSIRPDINFPFEGPNIKMFRGETIAIPATPAYNPRCK